MKINMIDVTLRDGGYKTNFHFLDCELRTILSSLDDSNIEYIEVGYRNGSLHPIKNIGSAGICDKKYLEKCRNLIKKSKLAVMFHSKNMFDDDLKELVDCGVDLVRICIPKNNYKKSLEFIEKSKAHGFSVSVNVTRASQYSEEEMSDFLSLIASYCVDMIYFADSNGSMHPSDVKSIYEKYSTTIGVPLGFHAHDNLGLAQANTLAAISGGASFIDASLAGIGKGVGNLKLEFFISYLHAIGIKKYDIERILFASNFVQDNFMSKNNKISMKQLLMGICNLSIDEIEKIKFSEKRAV